MQLDIIITHCMEQWYDGRKMFEMLKNQRGVDWNNVRVILVQDGEEDGGLQLDRIMKQYPFVDTVMTIPKSGVSAARNEGLRYSDAEWVMFCDFDDCLYSVDSLARIQISLDQAGDDADLVWSSFWMELKTQDGKWCKKLKGWNNVFIHGRCYRRSFLEEHGIWFDEDLTYSEDAMFNALVAMDVSMSRVAKMPEVVYMWCYREGSASNYKGGDAARNISLYKKRVRTCEAYQARNRTYDARSAATRTLLEYYWDLNGPGVPAGHTRNEWIRMLQEDIIRRWPDAPMQISQKDRDRLYQVTWKEAGLKKTRPASLVNPEDWLREIGAITSKGPAWPEEGKKENGNRIPEQTERERQTDPEGDPDRGQAAEA